jgi:hypothetical protein
MSAGGEGSPTKNQRGLSLPKDEEEYPSSVYSNPAIIHVPYRKEEGGEEKGIGMRKTKNRT